MNEKTLNGVTESIIDFCNALESAAVNLRRQIKLLTKTEPKARISEKNFNILKWQDEKGSRLGDFQAAYKTHNLPDNWHHAYGVLKANIFLISEPFHKEGYEYRYWIYPEKYEDRIFRKRLVEAHG